MSQGAWQHILGFIFAVYDLTDNSEYSFAASIQPKPRRKPRWVWFVLPVLFVISALVAVGYFITRRDIKIIDGDRLLELRTHQNTAEAVLREANVQLRPEDVVLPAPTTLLQHNDLVVVKRARPVRVQIDDETPKLILTQSQSANDILNQLGIKATAFDRLLVNGQASDILPVINAPAPATVDIALRRSLEIDIAEKDKPLKKAKTSAQTVGEALMQIGYFIRLADRISPSPAERVTPGMKIQVEPAKLASVVVDGRRVRTRTHQEKVSDVLAELNIALYDQDYTKPGINTPIVDGLEVQVVRVRRELVIEQSPLPFETRVEPNPNLEIDNQVLGQEGTPGVHEKRRIVLFENGVEVKRELVADFVAREPRPRIRNYGTKIVIRTLDTPSGPVKYWRKIRMYVTSYSPSSAGVSPSSPYYGIVRCGYKFRPGTVAIDPNIIPLKTNIYVAGYGQGVACDTGGGIIGKHIDLGYEDRSYRSWAEYSDVYLLTPVPANIRYVID